MIRVSDWLYLPVEMGGRGAVAVLSGSGVSEYALKV